MLGFRVQGLGLEGFGGLGFWVLHVTAPSVLFVEGTTWL